MASRAKSRTGGKSPIQSNLSVGSQSHGKRSGKTKEQRFASDGDRETLAFKVLSAENTKKLAAIEDVDELQEAMADVLQITFHSTDLKEGSILDYYVAGFWWGKEQSYSNEQLSAFFTVVNTLLENIKEKQMTLIDNLKEFRKMLAGIGMDQNVDIRPPSGGLENVFDVNQAKTISEYIYTSLFQHYKLFEFVHGHTQAEDIIGTDLEIEIPFAASLPWPPPLDEGIPEDIYQEYIATPPPTPEVQEDEDATKTEEDQNQEEDEASAESQHEADVLAQLSADEVKAIMDNVFQEMLGGLQDEVAAKLREKENAFITRINKIHQVADKR